MNETKVCPKCGQDKPITEFSKNKKNKDGHFTYCKECQLVINREYRIRKAEKLVASLDADNLKSKQPREIQQTIRVMLDELRSRGFDCKCKILYTHEINL